MDKQLVEQVTRMVVEKLNSPQPKQDLNYSSVKLWDHTSSKGKVTEISSNEGEESSPTGMASFSSYKASSTSNKNAKVNEENEFIRNKYSAHTEKEEELNNLKSKTPARIGVGRAGVRPRTTTWLDFRYDHAAAVDAVFGQVDQSLIDNLGLFTVNTKVTDQETYIRRPDYGRKLSDEAIKLIKEKCKFQPTVQIIASDGLSSSAINENLEDVYLALQQSLKSLGIDVGTPFYIEKGRVAVMDDVGEYLQPEVAVLLVGERPGLVSADSLSAYLCYKPRHGTIESQRQVVSNIHNGGIPPVEAGAYLGGVIEKILEYQASGVELVKKEG
ncbi:ethanolamine ammonia-lyase subunit EutC [Pontibacillus yanchengensis]|uniref:Ethanolamine ammonia-lyase subunit EutC n=2 Tax=Pontibacillus yanchengensis TaxID=462910 RepID=A0ACC7VL18_9BACI|nr:ethanolamine ammonia-lyase subunit EutC [Pontibacillus yanchengensis]MYL35762.1 ethanolamine ammonia-lyase subunit EutC [Pontibacillus yanchengensis]MYL55473.1 ethanolamine ammonia-lyase subunit EutC [Pontibacillus yanchengensis]